MAPILNGETKRTEVDKKSHLGAPALGGIASSSGPDFTLWEKLAWSVVLCDLWVNPPEYSLVFIILLDQVRSELWRPRPRMGSVAFLEPPLSSSVAIPPIPPTTPWQKESSGNGKSHAGS